MQPRSKSGARILGGLWVAAVCAACCGGCGLRIWKPWRMVLKHRVGVLVHEAYGGGTGYQIAGTLVYPAKREPVANRGPVKLKVTLGPASKLVETDERGRFEAAFAPADFQRTRLPGGNADLLFRLAEGEDRRLGIQFPDQYEQRDIVHINGEPSDWAVVVILHELHLNTGKNVWAAAPADQPKPRLGSPARLRRLLAFLRAEARNDPPAIYYVMNKPGACCRQIHSFLDVHRLPAGGMLARPVGGVAPASAAGVDAFRVAALHALNRNVPDRKWVVLGRLGTGDGPMLFEAKSELGSRLMGGYLTAARAEPWPSGLQELITLTSIKRMNSMRPLAQDLNAAGKLPLGSIRRASQLDW